MITIAEAIALVKDKIKSFESISKIELAIMEDETIEFEFGWMFFYQSEIFIKTGNENYLVGGNAPLIVDKYNGHVVITGTRLSEEFYLESYSSYREDLELFKKIIS